MIEGIEALSALERTGTISEAAAQLRLTQSAVSKRLMALQNEVSFKLLTPDGRRVKLTPEAIQFLAGARPLISELKNLTEHKNVQGLSQFSIALSDSIAASWGPKVIKQASRKIKNLELDLHVHRSPLVEENIKLGRYDLGLCIPHTNLASSSNLISTKIIDEPMVYVFNQHDPEKSNETTKLITIEKNSGTWKNIEDKIAKISKFKNVEYIYVESFAAIAQMVKEGFGNGLIPLGMALNLNIPKKGYTLVNSSLSREIKLIYRKNLNTSAVISEFIEHLKISTQDLNLK